MSGTTIPRGNILITLEFATIITPVSVAANTTAEQSFTIPGLQVGDYINAASPGAQTAGILIANVRVSAANTVAIAFANITGGGLVPVSGLYGFVLGRPENLPLPTNAT